jgi:hypothetical protein
MRLMTEYWPFDLARKLAHAVLRLGPLSQIGQRVLLDYEFTDQVHEPVDLGLIDLEAARAGLVVFGAAAKLDSIVGALAWRRRMQQLLLPRRSGFRWQRGL